MCDGCEIDDDLMSDIGVCRKVWRYHEIFDEELHQDEPKAHNDGECDVGVGEGKFNLDGR